MTPTLIGRWQTRTFLLLTAGLIVTFFFALLAAFLFEELDFLKPFAILFFVLVTGYVWDAIYIFLQRFRWDRDWPPAFQFLTALVEMVPAGILAWLLSVPWWFFLLHYWFTWWVIFIASQGPMRIFFPRWRFRGGRWL